MSLLRLLRLLRLRSLWIGEEVGTIVNHYLDCSRAGEGSTRPKAIVPPETNRRQALRLRRGRLSIVDVHHRISLHMLTCHSEMGRAARSRTQKGEPVRHNATLVSTAADVIAGCDVDEEVFPAALMLSPWRDSRGYPAVYKIDGNLSL